MGQDLLIVTTGGDSCAFTNVHVIVFPALALTMIVCPVPPIALPLVAVEPVQLRLVKPHPDGSVPSVTVVLAP